MTMLKKTLPAVLPLFCSLLCFAENFQALSDEDAGQLLYHFQTDTVYVFRRCVGETRRWECAPFRGNGSRVLDPVQCRLLDYAEAELTPEAAAVELAYWTSRKNRFRTECYRQIAEKMNAPATADLLAFYRKLEDHGDDVRRETAKYLAGVNTARKREKSPADARGKKRGGSSDDSPQDDSSALDMLEAGLTAAVAADEVVDAFKKFVGEGEKKNFLLAFCMYLSYRDETLRAVSGAPADFRKKLETAISRQGEEIRQKYQQERAGNQNREKIFKRICPGVHGRWEFAPPADIAAMRKFADSCYAAWRKIRTLSPYSEFPEWGSAMLEVMQMIRYPELERRFDAACAEYRKTCSN